MSALGEILTASGVPHTDHDVPGYGTPDNPTSSGTTDLFFGPELVMIHHWGATDDVGFDSLLNQAINGTSTLPPPVYQVFIDRTTAAIHLVSSGRANHAGAGDPNQLERVRQGLPVIPPSDTDAAGRIGGNGHSIGISLEGGQSGDDHPDAQKRAAIQVAAALCTGFNWDPFTRVLGHKEWTLRKLDPWYDMAWFRSQVALEVDEMLKLGDSGYAVSRFQAYLNRWAAFRPDLAPGWVPINRTDTFDEATRSGVIVFQRAHDLDQTGVIGGITAALLSVNGFEAADPRYALTDHRHPHSHPATTTVAESS